MNDYVESIGTSGIKIRSESSHMRQEIGQLGAREEESSVYWLSFTSEKQLWALLQSLINLKLAFMGDHSGWPPSEVVQKLREEGKVSGTIRQVTWRGPGEPAYRDV